MQCVEAPIRALAICYVAYDVKLMFFLQIAGNLINLPMFDDLIPATGRSLDPEDLVSYARLAADAYSKYQQLNNDVPK